MKKILTLLALVTLSLLSTAQNGGQFAENNVVRVKLESYTDVTFTFTIYSKQPCTADYRIHYLTTDSTVTLAALDSFTLTLSYAGALSFKGKALDACVQQPDMGWVEAADLVNVLPIGLSKFIAIKRNNQVELQWQTLFEANNKGFSIEHSIDGRRWNQLAFVNGSLFSMSVKDYSYSLMNVSKGINYYRLKQTDIDGKLSFSPVRRVDIGGKTMLDIYPNPVKDKLFIISDKEYIESILIIAFTGRIVKSYNGIKSGTSIDISTLSNGVYLIQMIDQTLKFIKQ